MSKNHIFGSTDELATAAADKIVEVLRDRLNEKDKARLVLTGGETPRRTYESIARHHSDSIEWRRVEIFMGDERFVPIDHDESNMGMAKKAFLDADGISTATVFPYPTQNGDPADAALEFERTLRDHFADQEPWFDLVIFGLGDDAHVASHFPNRSSLEERHRWVLHTQTPSGDDGIRDRLTLTFPLLNATPTALFLVAGEGKAPAVAAAQQGEDETLPVHHVRPKKEMLWYLDEAAAAEL